MFPKSGIAFIWLLSLSIWFGKRCYQEFYYASRNWCLPRFSWRRKNEIDSGIFERCRILYSFGRKMAHRTGMVNKDMIANLPVIEIWLLSPVKGTWRALCIKSWLRYILWIHCESDRFLAKMRNVGYQMLGSKEKFALKKVLIGFTDFLSASSSNGHMIRTSNTW